MKLDEILQREVVEDFMKRQFFYLHYFIIISQ
jgi:hypothetical protein